MLKPGGHLILTTPYHGRLKNLAIALFAFNQHFYPDNYRIRLLRSAQSRRFFLEGAGFTPREWSGSGEAGHFGNRFSWLRPKRMYLVLRPAASRLGERCCERSSAC